jgi:hypothetical protein
MKKLKTFADGSYMPLWQEDLAYIQENIIETIVYMAKAFSIDRTKYIVSGCLAEFDGNMCYYNKGMVMYNGELLVLKDGFRLFSLNEIPNPVAIIELDETFDSNGRKLFKKVDGTWEYRDTYHNRVAKITVKNEDDVISTDLIADGTDLWKLFPKLNYTWGAIVAPPLSNTFTVKMKKQGDIVAMKGAATYSEGVTSLCTVPEAFRPGEDRNLGNYTVKATGEIRANDGKVTSANFDDIMYLL